MVEHQIVDLVGAGSSPVDRPIFQTRLLTVAMGDISGNVGVFQVPVFPNKSGKPQITGLISGYFPIFQFGYT